MKSPYSMRSGFMVGVGLVISASVAGAAIVPSPGGFVDHGQYVEDAVTGINWYKFDNAVSTIGQSLNAVQAPSSVFSLAGWRPAKIGEVEALWQRFGYTVDTWFFAPGGNENSGLTEAVAALLGYTYRQDYTYSFVHDVVGLALDDTSPAFGYQAELVHSNVISDYVYLKNSIPSLDYTWLGAGVYLVNGGQTTVPEPGTLVLVLAAMLAISYKARILGRYK